MSRSSFVVRRSYRMACGFIIGRSLQRIKIDDESRGLRRNCLIYLRQMDQLIGTIKMHIGSTVYWVLPFKQFERVQVLLIFID